MQGHLVDDGPLRTSGLAPRANASRRMFAYTLLATPSVRSRSLSIPPVTIEPVVAAAAPLPTRTSIALVASIFAASIGGAVLYLLP